MNKSIKEKISALAVVYKENRADKVLAEILELLDPTVKEFANRYGRSSGTADDLEAHLVVSVWETLNKYTPDERPFIRLILKSLRNRCVNWTVKYNKIRKFEISNTGWTEDVKSFTSKDPDVLDKLVNEDIVKHLREQLNEDGRAIIDLVLLGYSWADAARAVGAGFIALLKHKKTCRKIVNKLLGTKKAKPLKCCPKLRDDQVREIRKMAAEGVSTADIAAKFGRMSPVICNVVKRKVYKNVKQENK